MSLPEPTEIRFNERGDEVHESWILARANTISGTPGASLFDSEIKHHRWVRVTITRCSRKRSLNRDWLHQEEVLLEWDMSQAQWGAFVSSFGDGGGIPGTLYFLNGVGLVPHAPAESRFDESHREVRDAGAIAMERVTECYQTFKTAFESGGKREQREALQSLEWAIQGVPNNMEFAAKSLTEHVENVVTKARADIEGMALAAQERAALVESTQHLLDPGKEA